MSAHLLISVWHDIADPWSRIRPGRSLRGIDLAHAQRNLSHVERNFRVGRDLTNAGYDETRSSASGTTFPEVVVDVYPFFLSGDPLSETSVEAIVAVAVSEGIPIAKERLHRPPIKPLRHLTHHIVHVVHKNAKDPADDVRRTPEAVIHPGDWFLDIGKVSDSGAPAGNLTQTAIQAGSELRLQKGARPDSPIHSEGAPPGGRGQAHQDTLDADQAPLEGDAIEPSPRTISRITGLTTPGLSTLGERLGIGGWKATVNRDVTGAKRLRIRGLPLTVVGAHAMLVGTQSPEVSAEAMPKTATALSDSEYPSQARRFPL